MISDYTKPTLVGAFGIWNGEVCSSMPDDVEIVGLSTAKQLGNTPVVSDGANCEFQICEDSLYIGRGYLNLVRKENFGHDGRITSITEPTFGTYEVNVSDDARSEPEIPMELVLGSLEPYTTYQVIIENVNNGSVTYFDSTEGFLPGMLTPSNRPNLIRTGSYVPQTTSLHISVSTSIQTPTFKLAVLKVNPKFIEDETRVIQDQTRNSVFLPESLVNGGSIKIRFKNSSKLYGVKTLWRDPFVESSNLLSKSTTSSFFNGQICMTSSATTVATYQNFGSGFETSYNMPTDWLPSPEFGYIDSDDTDTIVMGGRHLKAYSKEHLIGIYVYEWKSDYGSPDESMRAYPSEVLTYIEDLEPDEYIPETLKTMPNYKGVLNIPDLGLSDKLDLILENKLGNFNFISTKYDIQFKNNIINLHNNGLVGPTPSFKVNQDSITLADNTYRPLSNLIVPEGCKRSLSVKSINSDGSEGFYDALYDIRHNEIDWDGGKATLNFDFVCFDHPSRRAFAFYLDLDPVELVGLETFYVTFDVDGIPPEDFYIINGNDFFTRKIEGNHVIFKYKRIPGMVPENIGVSCITDKNLMDTNSGIRCVKSGVIYNFVINKFYENPLFINPGNSLGGILTFTGNDLEQIKSNFTIVFIGIDIDLSPFMNSTKYIDLFNLGPNGKIKLKTSSNGLLHKDVLVWNNTLPSDEIMFDSNGSNYYGLVPNTLFTFKRMYIINSIVSEEDTQFLKMYLDQLETPVKKTFGVPDYRGEFDDLYIRDKVFGFINGFDNQLKYWFKNKEVKVAGLDTLKVCKDGYMSGDGLGVVLKDDSMNFSNAYTTILNRDTRYANLELVDGKYKVTVPNTYDGEHIISIVNMAEVKKQQNFGYDEVLNVEVILERGSIDVSNIDAPNFNCEHMSDGTANLYISQHKNVSEYDSFLIELGSQTVKPGDYFYIKSLKVIASTCPFYNLDFEYAWSDMKYKYFKNHKNINSISKIFPRTISIDKPDNVSMEDYSVVYVLNDRLETVKFHSEDLFDYYQFNSTEATMNICKATSSDGIKGNISDKYLYLTNHKDFPMTKITSAFTNIPNTTIFDIIRDVTWENEMNRDYLKTASIREILLFNKDTPLSEIEYIIKSDESVRRSVKNKGVPDGNGVVPTLAQNPDLAGVFGIENNRPIFWFRDFNTTIGNALHNWNGDEYDVQTKFLAEKDNIYLGSCGEVYLLGDNLNDIIETISVNGGAKEPVYGNLEVPVHFSDITSDSNVTYFTRGLPVQTSNEVETLSISLGAIVGIQSVYDYNKLHRCKFSLRLYNSNTGVYIDPTTEHDGSYLFKDVHSFANELRLCIVVNLKPFSFMKYANVPLEEVLRVTLLTMNQTPVPLNVFALNFKGLEPMIGVLSEHYTSSKYTNDRQLQFNNVTDFDWDTSSIFIEDVELAVGNNGSSNRYELFSFNNQVLRVADECTEQITDILNKNPFERFDLMYSKEYAVLTNYVVYIKLITDPIFNVPNDTHNLIFTSPRLSGEQNFVNRFKILYVFDRVYHKNDFIQKVYSKIQINVNNLKYPNMVDYTGNTFSSLGTTVKSMEGMFRGISKMKTSSPQIWERNGGVFGKDCFLDDTNILNYDKIPGFWKGVTPTGKTISVNNSFGTLTKILRLPSINSK